MIHHAPLVRLVHHERMSTHSAPVQRQPLASIDPRSTAAARQLARILPAAGALARTGSTFNSAL